MFENKEQKPLFNACFEAYQKFLQDAKVDHCETGLGGYDAMVEAFGKKRVLSNLVFSYHI